MPHLVRERFHRLHTKLHHRDGETTAQHPHRRRCSSWFVTARRRPPARCCPDRAPGLHLADAGRAQAQVAADRISALGRVDAVYASPLERARETAAPIGKARGLKVDVDKGLLECDFGDWTGAELKKLMKLPEWNTVQRAPSTFRFPGGESFPEMQGRMIGTIDRLRAAHDGGVVVCVSHADTIKAAVSHAMGTHIDMFQRIVISPCSITAIAYSAGGPVVLTVNSTGGSLAELRPS